MINSSGSRATPFVWTASFNCKEKPLFCPEPACKTGIDAKIVVSGEPEIDALPIGKPEPAQGNAAAVRPEILWISTPASLVRTCVSPRDWSKGALLLPKTSCCSNWLSFKLSCSAFQAISRLRPVNATVDFRLSKTWISIAASSSSPTSFVCKYSFSSVKLSRSGIARSIENAFQSESSKAWSSWVILAIDQFCSRSISSLSDKPNPWSRATETIVSEVESNCISTSFRTVTSFVSSTVKSWSADSLSRISSKVNAGESSGSSWFCSSSTGEILPGIRLWSIVELNTTDWPTLSSSSISKLS